MSSNPRSALMVRSGSGAARAAQASAAQLAIAPVVAIIQVGLAALAAAHHPDHTGAFNGASVALLVAGPVALVARRRHPATVLGCCFAIALLYSVADYYPRGLVFPAVIIAFWSAMLAGRRRLGWLSIVAGYLLFVVLVPLTGAQTAPNVAWASGIAAWMLLLAAAAEIVRIRRERALQTAAVRSEQARRIAGEERLRIARDLHDVLAHNLSLINVQAGVALHLIDERPEQTRAALSAIKHASKDALGELRSVLDVLRASDERAPKAPSGGLDRLDQLVGRAQETGVPVAARIEGTPRPLPAGVDLAAYRIVQEALTNVARHAAGAPTVVLVDYRERELIVQVDNDGGGTAVNGSVGGGNGIAGMGERASVLGGVLVAGPRSSGGFRVRARLPLGDAP